MSINLGDLTATTLALRAKSIGDTITAEHPVLNRLASKGNVKETESGREIYQPIIYGDNSSVKWFSGYESFTPPTDQQIIDAAVYQWKQQGAFISISGLEQIQNSGESQAISFVSARIDQVMAQLKNEAGASVFSDGTGSGGKEIGGLQSLVADVPSAAGTVGGIDQAANSFWRNYANLLVAGSATTIGANITTAMNTAWRAVSVGSESPDLITMDTNGYGYYESTLQELVRFTQTQKADAGFQSLKYKNADVVFDAYNPADHIYMLNTDTLFLRAHPDRMWSKGKKREVTNADYEVIPIWFMGNMCTNNRKRNAVLKFTVS